MRLIDADEIIKWADDSVSQYGGTYSIDMLNMFGLFKEVINKAPTVDTDEIYKKGYHNGFFATHDVPPTVEPTYISDMPDDKVKDLQELAIDYGEGIAVFERKRPQGEQIAWEQGYEFGKNEKRPQGEWYYNYQNGWHCSICHEPVEDMPTVMGKANFAFCPNCGARMGGTT